VLIDLGGQSISLGVYCEGAIKYSKDSARLGLHHARPRGGLKTSISTAERMKIEHGIAQSLALERRRDIEAAASTAARR